MPEQIVRFAQSLKAKWDALEKSQRIKILACFGVVLLALAVTILLAVRTPYDVAYSNLTAIERNDIREALREQSIRTRTRGNSILVERRRLEEARVIVESREILVGRTFTFDDAVDVMGMGTTDSVRRDALRRAHEGDIANALRFFDGVISADVRLTLPEATRFFDRVGQMPSVSVLLTTSREITKREGENLARYIMRTTSGLEMEHIEVVDQYYRLIFSGSHDLSDDFDLAEIQQQRARETAANVAAIANLFHRLFDEVSVVMNLDFYNEIMEIQRIEFTPPVAGETQGMTLREQLAASSAQGTPMDGAPGFDDANQGLQQYMFSQVMEMRASQNETIREFAINQQTTQTRTIPIAYNPQNSTVTVNLGRTLVVNQIDFMNEDRNRTQADWEQLKRENAFPRLVVDDPDTIVIVEDMVRTATGIMNRDQVTVAIWEATEFNNYEPTPRSIQQWIMYAVLLILLALLALGIIRRTKPEEEDSALEPELSVEDLLVSTQLEEQIEDTAAAVALEAIGYQEDSEAKRQIEKFITEKPEAAASLLRHWLNNEDW
jgi:flagellar M-ring protein FliF